MALAYGTFKIPAVQRYFIDKIVSEISSELKTKVSIGEIDLNFFLDVIVHDITIYDRSNDTLFSAPRLRADIEDIWLRSKRLSLDEVDLDGAYVNVVIHPGDTVFNYMFIADYFAASQDTTVKKKLPWKIQCSSISMNNVRVKYAPKPGPAERGFINFWNLYVTNINGEIKDIITNADTISASVTHLSAREQSGFVLKDFSTQLSLSSVHMHASSLKMKTEKSECSMNLDFSYPNYDSYNHFIEQVKMTADIKRSKVCFSDLSYFAGYIDGMTETVYLSGNFKGTVDNFTTKDIVINYGDRSVLKGDFSMTGLPGDAFIYYKINELKTNVKDISDIPLPPFNEKGRIGLPEFLDPVGDVSYKGVMSGFFYDFVADGLLKTGIGDVDTDIKLSISDSGDIKYSGNFQTADLDIGLLVKDTTLGRGSMTMKIDGQGVDENVNAFLKGDVESIEINNYRYKNINVDGQVGKKLFNGSLQVDDPNLGLDFTGKIDFGQKVPLFNFTCSLDHSDLKVLNILTNDTILHSSCKGQFTANFTGMPMGNIDGVARVTDFNFELNNKSIDVKSLSIIANESDNLRTIVVKSDVLDANLSGKFDLERLASSFKDFLATHMPGMNYRENILVKNFKKDSYRPQKIDYFIRFKDVSDVADIVLPGFDISNNAQISGRFDSEKNDLTCDMVAKSISYQGTVAKNTDLKVDSRSGLRAELDIGNLSVNNQFNFDNFSLGTGMNHDTLDFKILWNNNSTRKYNGKIEGKGLMSKYPYVFFTLLPSEFTLSDTLWNIAGGNMFCIDTTSLIVSQLNLSTGNGNLSMAVDGKISESPLDSLYVRFKDFSLSNINFLTIDQDLTFAGKLTGALTLANVYKNFFLKAGVGVEELTVNGDNLGRVSLESYWDPRKDALNVNGIIHRGDLKSLIASGYYYPSRDKDNLDINIEINKFKPHLFEHYLEGYVKDLSRKTNLLGNLKLRGTLNAPEFSGKIQFLGVGFRLDYTNCFYQFSDVVRVEKNGFYFDNVTVEDTANHFAKVNGSIKHKNFKDFVFDVNINMDHFQALNTELYQNELFYGSTVASGRVKITGTPENVKMDIVAKTEKDTRFFLPLNTTYELTENPYITFENKNESRPKEKDLETDPYELTGIEMNFDLEVTPDAEIQIILDEKIGDIIKARGNANLKLDVTTLGDFSMYGDYIIEKGDYLFTLQNVINKHFEIEKGSSLEWNGDPYEGIADIKAAYHTRTSLKPLRPSTNVGLNIDTTSRRMPVDCRIDITDRLMNPNIGFEILFPSLRDDESRRYYQSAVQTDLTQQVFSLLVVNSFTVPSNIRSGDEGQTYSNNAVGANSSELLSNQLSNWLSQVSNDFDVGVNYRAGDQNNSDEWEISPSMQLLDDRLTIDGNFGVAGRNQQNASNIVGDVNIEYKLSKDGKVRVKAYNKTNSNSELISKNAKYTQGLGLFYRKEFDRFWDLFKKN